jgi:hypothetical protein
VGGRRVELPLEFVSGISLIFSFWMSPAISIYFLFAFIFSLDIDAVNALINAIKSYEGGVLIVSHDEHLIS